MAGFFLHDPGTRRGGGLLSLDVENSTFSILFVLPNSPAPICISFSKEKHPIFTKLGAFYNNLSKIHPIPNFYQIRCFLQ